MTILLIVWAVIGFGNWLGFMMDNPLPHPFDFLIALPFSIIIGPLFVIPRLFH